MKGYAVNILEDEWIYSIPSNTLVCQEDGLSRSMHGNDAGRKSKRETWDLNAILKLEILH